MNEIEYIQLIKKVRRKVSTMYLPAVAEENEMPERWLRKFVSRSIDRPRGAGKERVERLAKYFGIVE